MISRLSSFQTEHTESHLELSCARKHPGLAATQGNSPLAEVSMCLYVKTQTHQRKCLHLEEDRTKGKQIFAAILPAESSISWSDRMSDFQGHERLETKPLSPNVIFIWVMPRTLHHPSQGQYYSDILEKSLPWVYLQKYNAGEPHMWSICRRRQREGEGTKG